MSTGFVASEDLEAPDPNLKSDIPEAFNFHLEAKLKKLAGWVTGFKHSLQTSVRPDSDQILDPAPECYSWWYKQFGMENPSLQSGMSKSFAENKNCSLVC